jgi:hypothetical protein
MIIFLLHCLVPGLGELVETVVHKITTGHFAHSAGEPHDEGSNDGEHGCTPTAHRCHCCSNQPALARVRFLSMNLRTGLNVAAFAACDDHERDGIPSAVFRPPIR